MAEEKKEYYVYILETLQGSLYTGYALDWERRYREHCEGRGARYTRAFGVRGLKAVWALSGTPGDGLRLEARIKKLSRKKKEHLIDNPEAVGAMIPDGLEYRILTEDQWQKD